MKKLYILSLLLVFVACTRVDYARRLADADSLLSIHPDSALTLLRGIPPARLHTEEERMRHALLTVEAECRNRVPQRDDSLPRTLVNYYQVRRDESMQARSYYVLGLVNNGLNRENAAITAFLSSEIYAKKTENTKLLGRIYGNMGYLYQTNDVAIEADSMYHLAEQMARLAQDSAMLAEALTRQSMYLMGTGKASYPQAKQLLLEAYHINYGTVPQKRTIAMSLSVLYQFLQQPDSMIFYARRAVDLCRMDTSGLRRAQYFLGNAFYQYEHIDSASFYYKQSLHASSFSIKAGAYMQLAKIAQNEKNWKLAIEYQEQASRYKEKLHVSSQKADIISAQKDLEVNKKLSLIQAYQQLIWWVILALLITIGICLFLLTKIRKQKILYESMRKDLSSKELLSFSSQTSTAEVKEDTRANTCTEDVFEYCQRTIRQSELYRKMQRMVNYQKEHPGKNPVEIFDVTERKQLISEVNDLIPGYVERLSERYPALDDTDIFILCLCLVGIPIPHIACVMDRTRDNVYKRLRSIRKEKMKIESSDNSVNEVLSACKQV